MKKSEIRKLIKEVLQERWSDFLTKPIVTNRKKTLRLYTSIDQWVKDMIDPLGKYIGPNLNGFKYDKGDNVIHNVTEPYTSSLMYTIMEWNDALARYANIDLRDVVSANKSLDLDFYEHHAEDALGYFPTEQ